MRVSLLTIGSELLDGTVTDTNSVFIASELENAGLELAMKLAVPDDAALIKESLAFLSTRSDLVLLTGGLGPTEDDKTREVTADYLGKKLFFSEGIAEGIQEKFKGMHLRMPHENRRQAMVIEGAEIIENPNGTAPGFLVSGPVSYAAFPGVPSELYPMFRAFLPDWISRSGFKRASSTVYLRTTGIPESALDETVSASLPEGASYGTVANYGMTDIRLTLPGCSPEEALSKARQWISGLPGFEKRLYATDRKTTLAAAVLNRLASEGKTLAAAESCSGGLISKLFTDVPGSSRAYLGGVVSYSNALKEHWLGVEPETFSKHGAVSFETAQAMLKGLREHTGADFGVAVTGIAGPEGGSEEKPVGTVFIGIYQGEARQVFRFHFPGDRAMVRDRTANRVLNLVWDMVQNGLPLESGYSSQKDQQFNRE